MSRLISEKDLHAGDTVLIRGRVVRGSENPLPLIAVGHTHVIEPRLDGLEILAIEKPAFRVGDRVIADGHPGLILFLRDNVAWVEPDGGNRRPWTVDLWKCEREPAPKPSAEILAFQESAPVRPCDTEDTAA